MKSPDRQGQTLKTEVRRIDGRSTRGTVARRRRLACVRSGLALVQEAIRLVDAAQAVSIHYPPKTASFHHEIELVLAIGRAGCAIAAERALEHVYGYAVGLDMARRDLQLEARDKGRPWEFRKSFDKSAPIGAIHRSEDIGHVAGGTISVTVNGLSRQACDVSKLIWSVSECVACLSQYEALQPEDLIMTGTPEGVNAVLPGDVRRGHLRAVTALTPCLQAASDVLRP